MLRYKITIWTSVFLIMATTTLVWAQDTPTGEGDTAAPTEEGAVVGDDSTIADEGTGTGVGDTADSPVEAPAEPPLPDVEEVMDRLDNLWRAESSYAMITMSITTENWSRTLTIEGWSKGEDLSLMIIREPAREAGTATLRTEEGLWNYAPRADRLMRIPSGLLSESWMGSHFTNDDLMRESGYDDDFDTELSWAEEEGAQVLVATMIPHPDAPIVYSRVIFHMDYERYTPLRAEYFDDDEMVRTFRFSQVREINGLSVPMRMDVIPHDKPGESTVIEYNELELDVPVDDNLFTQRGLRREAQRR